MNNGSAIKHQSGYYQGYSEGFNEGYLKAYEEFRTQLLLQTPHIIVTTQDNFERVKEQFNK
jgi:flagellar biosynthesis/type III secretory pathway protein FliH